MNQIKVLIAAIIFVVSGLRVHAENLLQTPAGTMSAGGSASIPVEWDPARGFTIGLDVRPEFGLFLWDNWELTLEGKLKTSDFGNLSFGSRDESWRWGVRSGMNYYFDFDSCVRPFIGVSFGFEIANFALSTFRGSVDIPVGVLMAINSNMAFVLGISTQVEIAGVPSIFRRVRFGVGCLGFRAFF